MSSLKLVASSWLMPLPLGLVLVCAGLLLRMPARRPAASILIILGLTIAVAATFGPVADALLGPLEMRYAAVLDASALQPPPQYVAVLGSGYYPRAGLPVTAALDSVGIVRLVEGVRLMRQLPGAKLILSGGAHRHEPPVARGYVLAATALGVPAESVILLESPEDTAAEIRALHRRIGEAGVLLVTSAAHMPRAMALSRREGLHATPAPTGNLTAISPWSPLPSGSSLRKSETALHEYEGLVALEMGID